MSTVTDADRQAARASAHHLVARGGGCFVISGRHSDHCDAATELVAEPLATAREAGERAGADKQLRFALFAIQDELRVASSSRKRGMPKWELYYWDGRQEAVQRLEKIITEAIAARRHP